MAKGTLEIAEYQWAQKVYKQNSWPFDAYDGDPTPAKIAAHCKQRSANYKKALKKYAAEKKNLKTQAQIDTFAPLHKNCQDYLTSTDNYLKAMNIADASEALDDVDAILDAIGNLFTRESGGTANGAGKQDLSAAKRQKDLEASASRLAFYGSQRKDIHNPEQLRYFSDMHKQAEWNLGEAAKHILNGNLEQADDLLFQTEAHLKGLEGLIALVRKQASDLNDAKAGLSNAKARMASAYKLRKTIADKQARKEFEDQHKQAKAQIKSAEGMLKKDQLKEARPVLASVDHLVEQMEYATGTNTWAPIDPKYARELKGYKIDLQLNYQQINSIPDKAAKREFEQHYQVAISLVADTEVLIEGDGRAAEDKVKSNIKTIQGELRQIELCVSKSFDTFSTEPGDARHKQAGNALRQELDKCHGDLQATQTELNRAIKNKSALTDPQISKQFMAFAEAAQSYISEGLQYVASEKIQEAKGKLQTCKSAITSMEFLLESTQAVNNGGDQSGTSQSQAQPKKSPTEQVKAQHQAIMARLKNLLAQEAIIQDQKQQEDFATYKLLADQLDSIISDLIQRDKINDARAELVQLEGMTSNLQACIDEANATNSLRSTQQRDEQRIAEERQQAGAYRTALNTSQRTAKKLEAQQPQILDPGKQQRYAALLTQISELITEIGGILATSQDDRIQRTAQLMPRLDGFIQQAQDIYEGAMAAQQLEESLRAGANECRAKAKAVAAKAAFLRKNKKDLKNPQQQTQLGTYLGQITDKIREINLMLVSKDPNRVANAEALLPVLNEAYMQAQNYYNTSLSAPTPTPHHLKKNEIRYKHKARGIRNNVDSRATPSGPNPDFYCEQQDGMFCLKHSINACLGYGAITPQDMEDGLLATSVDGFKTQTDRQLFSELKNFYPGLKMDDMLREKARDPEDFYRKAAKKQFAQLLDGVSPADYIREHGSDPHSAIAIMKSKQKQLGLPDLKDTFLDKPKTQADLQKNVDKVKEITSNDTVDRLVLGAGAHFIALRKNQEGDWFEVDSQKPAAKRIDLEEYIRNKSNAHRNEALAILHFDGDVNAGGASQPRR
ncbi:hypothetical protein [Pseudovibrio brasiliensis]|uniref:Ubiquitinyl hydrolase 1 n=1 Tax=Pseudovibrio brasiliensis TaxID=1898042 RepID=A0ABX8ANL1_9HYPH|nr:hypothetical protein [Pseudovibrio brasiliensis]QUS55847.1 hypothetical protein KGB56_21610 [Pseudovibrio brasiliensis]